MKKSRESPASKNIGELLIAFVGGVGCTSAYFSALVYGLRAFMSTPAAIVVAAGALVAISVTVARIALRLQRSQTSKEDKTARVISCDVPGELAPAA